MNSAIGIDIGGTKISLGLGLESGRQVAAFEIPTRTGKKTRRCLNQMLIKAAELAALARKKNLKLAGIGVCLPGAVNPDQGIIPRSPNLPGWKGIPLKKILAQKFRLPVRMANDANAVAVAEKIFGQAKNLRNFIYITVSTGVGSGIFSQGKLLEGAGFAAGEIGHMTLVPEGNRCRCGKRGCLEAYASGTALAEFAKAELKRGVRSRLTRMLKSGEALAAKTLGKAAREGDSLALSAYECGGYYLGIGIGNLLQILNPQKVILGGGVFSSAPPVFWKSMMKSIQAHTWPEAFHAVKISRSKLQGHMGALALVFHSKTE